MTPFVIFNHSALSVVLHKLQLFFIFSENLGCCIYLSPHKFTSGVNKVHAMYIVLSLPVLCTDDGFSI